MATREQLLDQVRQADAAGDKAAAAFFMQKLRALSAAPPVAVEAPAPAPVAAAPTNQQINEDTLRADPDWIAASAIIYEMDKGRKPDATMAPKDVANYGLDNIGMFNNNLVDMGAAAARLQFATPEQKKAYLYLMDGSEKLGWSWEAFGQGIKGIALDPTTYVGIASLGVGTAAAQGGKVLTKEGLKLLLKTGINMGVRGAIDGAVFGAATDTIRQTVEIQGGGRTEYDPGQIAAAGATNAAMGFVLGGVVGGVEHGIKTGQANKLIGEAEAVFSPNAAAPPISGAAPNAPGAPVAAADPNLPVSAANDLNAPHDPATMVNTPNTSAVLPEGVVPANAGPANSNLKGLSGPILGAQTHLNSIVDAIKKLAPTDTPTAIRQVDGVQKLSMLNAATKGISQMLEHAARLGDGATLTDLLERTGVTGPQMQVLKHSAQQANDALLREIVDVTKQARAGDKASAKVLRQTVDALEATRATVEKLDGDLSTQTGRDLRMRQEGLVVGEIRGLSVKGLMDEKNLSRPAAEAEMLHVIKQRESTLANKAELTAIDRKIEIATKAQDYTTVQQLQAEKKSVLGRTDTQTTPDGSAMGKVYRALNRTLEGVLEVMISNVFSLSTIVINTIPTYAKLMTKPFVNYVATGVADGAAFRGMLSSYSVMVSVQGAAFKAGALAFKYEKALLLQDTERSFFGSGIIPKRFGGGIIRFIPRLLNATDEYMGQIAYRSYGVGQATANAITDAKLAGHTGKDAEKFIKQAVKDATERLYSTAPEGDQHVVDMLISQAQDRGLSGEAVNKWVRKQLMANPTALKQAENGAGKDYVKDLLFKREFSGTNPASKVAKEYEAFVHKNPIMKLVGQLFFRTPIRVFEEGLRLTPGLNLVNPLYIADLAGKNGAARQIKAQGEAMISYGIGASVMTLYAGGSITGGGPSDYHQRRQGENTDNFEPYTITFPNGEKWSYRNLDPISTPLKIMVNALDRIRVLQYREAQGETPDAGEMEKAVGYMSAGVAAIAQSISDANLMQGVANTASFFNSLNDPRAGNQGDQVVKAVGNFLATAIPATWTKSKMVLGEGFQNDPITIEQILRAKINPDDPLVPRQYTAIGRPRTLSNPEANLFVFHPSTPESRGRGKGAEEAAVEQDLWLLAQAADTDFTAPYKTRLLPQIDDLRKATTKDGKATYYDRWQQYVFESDVVSKLHAITVSSLPYGTPGDSPRATAVNSVLNLYREAAMFRLVREEVGGFQGMSDEKLRGMLQSQTSNLNTPFH